MTSVLRLGVYRERIEKYGAGGGGCKRQVAQPQQQVKAINDLDIEQNEVSGAVHDEASQAAPSSSTSPDGRTSYRAQPAVIDQGNKSGRGNNYVVGN